MNEFNAIKSFINIMFAIIIFCFSIFAIFELMFVIQFQKMIWDFPIHIFIIYMIIDFSIDLNQNEHLILYTRLRRTVKVTRFVKLY